MKTLRGEVRAMLALVPLEGLDTESWLDRLVGEGLITSEERERMRDSAVLRVILEKEAPR